MVVYDYFYKYIKIKVNSKKCNPIFKSISAVSFKSLNKLQSLSLRYCGIGSINMDAFTSAFCMPTASNTRIWMKGNPIVSSTEVSKLTSGICYNFNLVD